MLFDTGSSECLSVCTYGNHDPVEHTYYMNTPLNDLLLIGSSLVEVDLKLVAAAFFVAERRGSSSGLLIEREYCRG